MNSKGYLPPSECPVFTESERTLLDLLRTDISLADAAKASGIKASSMLKKLPELRAKHRDYLNKQNLGEYKTAPNQRPGR